MPDALPTQVDNADSVFGICHIREKHMQTYLLTAFFMLVILVVLGKQSATGLRQPKSRRRFLSLTGMTAAYVVMDSLFIVCHFTLPGVTIFNIVVFLFYIVYVMLPFIWHLFVRNFVGVTLSPTIRKVECIPIVILLVLVVLSPICGTLWSFDETGMYVRGYAFTFYSVLNLFYYVEPLFDMAVIFAKKNQDKEQYLGQAVLISMIPLIAVIGNSYIIPAYEIYPFQPLCCVIVVLLAFFFMASKESNQLQEENQRAITEALNQAREATLRATEASKVKTTFLSNMSHDIRTPMNAIINLTQLALASDDMTKIKEYLSKTEISGKFLLGLINDILDMSKIESGELVLKREPLTRAEFLDTVETVIRPLVDAKNINYHSELNPGEYTIMVDKLRFNQIFFNLLSNAVKFTPEGGDVWFEVHNVEVENNKLQIRFVVRDNGIGMSEEFQKKLFEPFAREHSQLNSKTQGTGLGLSIVKSLVDAMDGTITVKSKLGEGSEFDVLLYVDIAAREDKDAAAKAKAKQESEAAPDLSGMKVLLVEDNEINTYVAQIILENAGCVVTTAENGQAAVDTFTANAAGAFDAILMDVRMPVMDGLEATAAIRGLGRPDAKSIPIIAMTADAFDEDRKSTIEAGMNYHLSKPVDSKELYKVLDECRHEDAAKADQQA